VKLLYNSGAAVTAGYVAAWSARRAPVMHGTVLAAIQTAAFGFAISSPELHATTPSWMWAALVLTTAPAIVVGAAARRHQLAGRRTEPRPPA